MPTAQRMPAAFIGHGSPMNTLEVNRYTSAWRALGASVPRPRAILSISAHWFIQGTAVTAMPRPRVIHDFYGFPRELFDFDYPAPGAPDVAREVADVVRPQFVGLDEDSWGLDHGTWSVLAHMFPNADVPVVQLSLHGGQGFGYHFDLGVRLAPLRECGIFIIGSGNVVHNLRRVDWSQRDSSYDWGDRFDAEVRRIMMSDPRGLHDVEQHRDYAARVPTPEHFLPVAYLAGLCSAEGEGATVFVEGGTLGSITMTSYVLGAPPQPAPASAAPGPGMPNPATVPPEQTNL